MTNSSDIFYRRNLPHWQPAGAPIFLTWRLYGSLPKKALRNLEEEKHRLQTQPVRSDETPRDRALRHSKGLFALVDNMLNESTGPKWLKDEHIAQLVVDALFFHDTNLYALLAFVIMPNHLHVLLRPSKEKSKEHTGQSQHPQYVPLRKITQSLKGYTARKANQWLKRTGQTFWQSESYDHWVRDEAELERITTYIEWDPVKSGLVDKPEQWRWSSAWERKWGRMVE